jgi:CheY-like chemotaxis protein
MPVAGSAATREGLEARASLLARLETAYGSAADALAAIERALLRSNRTEVPASVPEILAFVRTGLLRVLSDDLGPRLTMTLLEDFIAEHEIRSGVTAKESGPRPRVPKPRPMRVLLVDADRVNRTTLARGLARERCLVTIAATLEELGEIARSGEEIDAAVVDARHPARMLIIEMIVDRFPDVAIVVRSAAEEATGAMLHALGVPRFEVVPVDVPPEAVAAAVLRVGPGRD